MPLIDITPYRYGGYIFGFRNPKLHEQAVRGMQCHTDEQHRDILDEGGVLIQIDDHLPDLSPRQRRQLDRGYTITVRMDAWEAAHYYGWDAHTAFEGPAR